MRRREFLIFAGGTVLTSAAIAQISKRPIVVFVNPYRGGIKAQVEKFVFGLSELGWMVSSNVDVLIAEGEDKENGYELAVTRALEFSPSIIVTASDPVLREVMKRAPTLPIICSAIVNPIETRLIETYRHPGGNVTGIQITQPSITGLHVAIAHEIMPTLKSIGILSSGSNPTSTPQLNEGLATAQMMDIRVVSQRVNIPESIATAFDHFVEQGVEIVVLTQDAMFNRRAEFIARLALDRKLPTISNRRLMAEAGGLLSYGASNEDSAYRAAWYVDQVIRGKDPGDLPVEIASRYALTINSRTAQAIGLSLPDSLLSRADEVIE